MPLGPGARLGAYEVLSSLGEGGMGEVYRARDAKLRREVALKILPADVAGDPDRVARFLREAQAASALNHPHIVAVHDSGEADGTRFIAMELVEGVPLTTWVERAVPDLPRLLDVFLQLADALATAHQAGIVHRDLKPANVLVTAQGYVKVVDFGLAKMGGAANTTGATITVTGTAVGQVMGTVSYMAPEQALGRPADARSDAFSLGVMLFEALAGKRPFDQPSALDTLHAIVHSPPPQPPSYRGQPLPPEVGWVLDKCLAKDPDERYQSMRDLAADLRRVRREAAGAPGDASKLELRQTPGAAPGAGREAQGPTLAVGRARLWAGALALALAAGSIGAGLFAVFARPGGGVAATPLVSGVTRLTWDPGYEGEPSWAPDGRSFVYTSDRAGHFDIYLSQVSGGPALNLTQDPSDNVQPAFSPDGKQIAFVSSRKGRPLRYSTAESPRFGGSIFVMSALGGPARFVAEGNFPAWSADGNELVFIAGGWFERRLYHVPVTGGTPQRIPVKMEASLDARATPGVPQDLLSPACSPDGRFIAFEALGTVYVVPVGGGDAVAVAQGRGPAWVRQPLALVYTTTVPPSGALWRVRVSPTDGRPAGPPEPITVGHGEDTQAAASPDGRSIVFAAMERISNVERLDFDLDRVLPSAAAVPVTTGNDPIYFFNSSPDGRSIVYESPHTRNIWIAPEGKPAAQVSVDATRADAYPRWSPDGRRIVFSRSLRAQRGAPSELWLMDPDGSNPRSLGVSAFNNFVSWTADSRALVLEQAADRQLHLVDVESKADRRLTGEPGVMPVTGVSRDGAWLAFQSTDSPHRNVVLRAVRLPDGGRSQVVVDTGDNAYHPFFSPSGAWVYFTPDHQSILRVPGPGQQWQTAVPERVTAFDAASAFIEDPQPSGDGRGLLFARRRLAADLWMLTLER